MEHLPKWPRSSHASSLNEVAVKVALVLIAIYQTVFSGLLWSAFGNVCRFHPSCSAYAQQAFQRYSFFAAFGLTAKRLCKCHPLGPFGDDPVPERKTV